MIESVLALQCRLECKPGYVAQRKPLITCVNGEYVQGFLFWPKTIRGIALESLLNNAGDSAIAFLFVVELFEQHLCKGTKKDTLIGTLPTVHICLPASGSLNHQSKW